MTAAELAPAPRTAREEADRELADAVDYVERIARLYPRLDRDQVAAGLMPRWTGMARFARSLPAEDPYRQMLVEALVLILDEAPERIRIAWDAAYEAAKS